MSLKYDKQEDDNEICYYDITTNFILYQLYKAELVLHVINTIIIK